MKNSFIKVLGFLTSSLFASCSHNSIEEILFRTTEDPFYDVLQTDSLSLENTVYLTWQEDKASDCFYLMKAEDKKNLVFECIYEGTKSEYTDSDILTDHRYVYRLDKKRGDKLFKGNTFSYGYGCQSRKDMYEDNYAENSASYLEYDLICNLPCVQYVTEGILHTDTDWFYVTVPPRRTAEILLSQKGLSNTSTGTATQLMFQEKGKTSENVKEKTALGISNTSNETKNFYFKIYPDTTNLFTSQGSSTVIEYTVSLSQIINYKL